MNSDLKNSTRNNSSKAKSVRFVLVFVFVILAIIIIYLLINLSGTDKNSYETKTTFDDTAVVDTLISTLTTNKFFIIDGQNFTYTGGTSGDLPEGEGTAFFENGDIYKGSFKNGYREGKGRYFFKNGDIIDGNFKINEPYGIGKYIFKDSSYYEGTFYNSVLTDKVIMHSADGSIIAYGYLKDGKLIDSINQNK